MNYEKRNNKTGNIRKIDSLRQIYIYVLYIFLSKDNNNNI